MSLRAALCSAGSLHSETFHVWLHAVLAVAAWLLWLLVPIVDPDGPSRANVALALNVFMLGAILALVTSATFHLLRVHERTMRALYTEKLALLVLLGAFDMATTLVDYADDDAGLKTWLLLGVGVHGSAALNIMCRTNFHHSATNGVLALYAGCTVFTWLHVILASSSAFVPTLAVFTSLLGIAILLNASAQPELFIAERFPDSYVGLWYATNSHQLAHVVVLVATGVAYNRFVTL